jgi:Nitroreductase family
MEFPQFVPAPKRCKASDQGLLANATGFYQTMQRRRTIRDFSDRPVPREVIEQCIRAAGTAPNGANLQPWHFVEISNLDLKHKIRMAAEIEEKEFYTNRAPKSGWRHWPRLARIRASRFWRRHRGSSRFSFNHTESWRMVHEPRRTTRLNELVSQQLCCLPPFIHAAWRH